MEGLPSSYSGTQQPSDPESHFYSQLSSLQSSTLMRIQQLNNELNNLKDIFQQQVAIYKENAMSNYQDSYIDFSYLKKLTIELLQNQREEIIKEANEKLQGSVDEADAKKNESNEILIEIQKIIEDFKDKISQSLEDVDKGTKEMEYMKAETFKKLVDQMRNEFAKIDELMTNENGILLKNNEDFINTIINVLLELQKKIKHEQMENNEFEKKIVKLLGALCIQIEGIKKRIEV